MSRDIAKLIKGFKAFRATYFASGNDMFRRLVEGGQSPKVLVVACSDSRVDPAILTAAQPGELFVIRNVANVVPPYQPDDSYQGTPAALEFSVRSLEVEHIVVLGHTRCGGIRSLIEGADRQAAILGPWMQVVRDACAHVPEHCRGDKDQHARATEKAALLISLENLLGFPWIRKRVEAGRLVLHAWYFDLDHGTLQGWDAESGEFRLLA